jgi:hypothetical protein
MNAEEQARSLCARALATDDPNELDEILAQLHALLKEHSTIIEKMIEERRLRADLQHALGKSA